MTLLKNLKISRKNSLISKIPYNKFGVKI